MNYKTIVVLSLIFFSSLSWAKQAGLSVPFENFFLTRGSTLAAVYNFKNQSQPYQVIFCFNNNTQANDTTIGIITWPLNGITQTAFLPIFLQINSRFQGSPADVQGTITITNNTNSYLIVNCLFAI